MYAVTNQGALTAAEALVTISCRFWVPQELNSDQSRNFESRPSSNQCD
jgi:hypothetical protein